MSDTKWSPSGSSWISSTAANIDWTFNPGTVEQTYRTYLGSDGWMQFEKAEAGMNR